MEEQATLRTWLDDVILAVLREAMDSCGISRRKQGTMISRVHLELEYGLIGAPRLETDELESAEPILSPIEAA